LPPQLPAEVTRAIKSADQVCAYFEAIRLAGFSLAEAERFFGARPSDLPDRLISDLDSLVPLPTAAAQTAFLSRFANLSF
jgi:hypothetical protein